MIRYAMIRHVSIVPGFDQSGSDRASYLTIATATLMAAANEKP